ncbi:hypothetical protein [Shinella zoogloeoides]
MGYADFLLYRTNMNAFLRLAVHCHRSVLALADLPSIQVVVSKQLQWGQEGAGARCCSIFASGNTRRMISFSS